MKDFYKRLKLPRVASDNLISMALDRPLNNDQGELLDARAVLLTPHRRLQYDRVHIAIKHIAMLRKRLELESTPFARSHESDFVVVHSDSQRRSASAGTSSNISSRHPVSGRSIESIGQKLVLTAILISGVYVLIATLTNSNSQKAASPSRVPTTNAQVPVLPLPVTGTFGISFSSTQNSIIVKTRPGGTHTLVKIERTDGTEIVRGFIRAGEQLAFPLPSGTYILKTASGTTWYGDSSLFGPETAYSRPDDTFPLLNFGENWTVELIPQRGGNLRDRRINAAEF